MSESVDILEHIQKIGAFLITNVPEVKQKNKKKVSNASNAPNSPKADSENISSHTDKSFDKIIAKAIEQGHFYFKLT